MGGEAGPRPASGLKITYLHFKNTKPVAQWEQGRWA